MNPFDSDVFDDGPPSRAWTLRIALVCLVVLLLVPVVVSAFDGSTDTEALLQKGTVERPADGTTVIAVQGYNINGNKNRKKPSRLVGVGPNGSVRWTYDGEADGIDWFYDVDPMGDGTLLVVGTRVDETTVMKWNPATKEAVWRRDFDWDDTHDVDLINGDQLLVANMRNYNETTDENEDRLLVYDLSEDRIVWQWHFDDYYPRDSGGKYTGDWTHVNDVDKLGPGRYMASPRNHDEVIVVNRTTGNVTMRLGRDGNHSVLYEQHNPQYLRGANGTPTMLVADSENDRIVEYARDDGNWTRTWTLTNGLNWPRDADRLPNGNTLVTDTLHHRVVEVTPTGEVVWEFYATFAPYDAERVTYGDEPGGPTVREQNATGRYNVTGGTHITPDVREGGKPSAALQSVVRGTPVEGPVTWLAQRWEHVTPWVRPVWLGPWGFAFAALAALVVLLWGVGEAVYQRERIVTKGRETVTWVRNAR